MKTLGLQQAADFLHIHRETLRKMAKTGEIPGNKVGKCWVFIQGDLADWLRDGYAEAAQRTPRLENGGRLCHSTNVVELGGLTSQHQMDKEYAALLKL